jgi:hypothetical protein
MLHTLNTLRYMTADDWSFYIDSAVWMLRAGWCMAAPWVLWLAALVPFIVTVPRHRNTFAALRSQQ